MKHVAYTTDIHTGQILSKIDLGSFNWRLTINDSSLSTQPSRKVGEDEVTDVDVRWSAVPGQTQAEKALALMPGMRAIAIFSQDDDDPLNNGLGVPMLWGGIDVRKSDWEGTSFGLESIYQMLGDRYAIPEGWFTDNRSKNVLNFSKATIRGIAAYIGWLCTSQKPGGELPVDWQYINEKHTWIAGEDSNKHVRNYQAWNVNNISGKDIFDKLAGVQDGVDMQWRPYMSDIDHVRNLFVAGTDEEQYLKPESGQMIRFVCHEGTGNLENLEVDYSKPYQRVYATGSGEDAETLTAFAEDLSSVNREGGLALHELAMSATDDENFSLLKRDALGRLEARKRPLMQFSGEFDENDPNTPRVGLIHSGEPCIIDLQGYPDIPDGLYKTRIMELSGDETSRVKVLFDVLPAPYF